MAILRVKKGPLEGAEFPVFSTRDPTVIGRDPNVEVPLQDQRASRRHSAIALDHGRWMVRDLDSSNGTILSGKRISQAVLTDGALLQVGSHQLLFHASELTAPPSNEFYGTQLLEAVREEAGAFVFRGYQHAMDRNVRADWLHPMRCPADPSVVAGLTQAVEAARSLDGQLVPVLKGKVSPAIDADALSGAGPGGLQGTWVILRGEILPSLEAELNSILKRNSTERVAVFRQLVERILERASGPLLAYPVGLASVGVNLESGASPHLAVPALDLGPCLANQTGDARHLQSLAPYLAPEYQEGPPADWRAALTYNLGAMGHHLLTGRTPTGDASAIEENDAISPDLASLLDRMLSTDPALRPAADGELLERIREVIPDAASSSSASAFPAADAREDDEILAELKDSSLSRIGKHEPPPVPAARSARPARPSRPISRRRRAARRSSGLLYLPLWILVWAGLFFAARYLSKIVFHELGL